MLNTEATIPQKADALLEEIRTDAYARQKAALTERSLTDWFQAIQILETYKERSSVQWILELPDFSHYSFEDFAEHEFGDENRAHVAKQVQRIEDMYTQLQEVERSGALPARAEEAQVLLKRVRDYRDYTYQALAILPPGVKRIFSEADESKPSVVFIAPNTPCVNHACDMIYKQFREAGSQSKSGMSGYIATAPIRDLYKFINGHGATQIEFMNPNTRETLDKARFVMCALVGIYDNVPSIEIPPELLPQTL